MAITFPYTFVNGTTADAAEVNANFDAVSTYALNKTGDTMTGDFKFTDATYDIGKSGATRPRDIFASRNVVIGGTLDVTGALTITTLSASTIAGTTGNFSGTITATAAAAITLSNAAPEILASAGNLTLASNNGIVMQLDKNNNGSESFSVKNGGATDILTLGEGGNLTVPTGAVLAGTSTTTNLGTDFRTAGALWIADGMSPPTATAAFAAIYVDSGDGDLKVKFADGTTKTISVDT